MNNSDETLEQLNQAGTVLQAISELSKKLTITKKNLILNSNHFKTASNRLTINLKRFGRELSITRVSYDRLKTEVLMLRADVKELTEEIRHNKKVLV